jgi:uncharacterized protein (DUF2235 family)
MSKNIIFCADGTWDNPLSDTNVYALSKAAIQSSSQVVIYEDGVGSDGTPLQKLTGGALGDGLFQKIKQGYTSIAHVYEDGDSLFLFGFSRGAFTTRSLAGMIADCGLPVASPDDNLVNAAFQAYRDKSQLPTFLAANNMIDAKIKMVGVWDTVGALGIPAIFGGIDQTYGFLDTNLHPDVLNAYQALAIDERRQEFPPTLWTSAPAAGQVLEQVWFAGVHCDVGGGYPETGLSDTTYSWMLAKAMALGLQVAPGVAAEYLSPFDPVNALDTIHESWSPLWLFPKPRTVPTNAALANSVGIRCQYDVDYQPGNLTLSNGVPVGNYSTVVVVYPPQV